MWAQIDAAETRKRDVGVYWSIHGEGDGGHKAYVMGGGVEDAAIYEPALAATQLAGEISPNASPNTQIPGTAGLIVV
jgi:hypothetical protein